MRKLFLIAFVSVSLNTLAQNHFIGARGGLNMTNVTSDFFSSEHKGYRKGISAGLTYEYLFKKNFSLGVDLMYNQRGFTNDLIFIDEAGVPTGKKITNKFNYDYVSLPIKAGYHFENKFYGFMNIGVVPSLLISATTITPEFYIPGSSSDVTNRVNKFDLAGIAEIGAGYKFMERYCLFALFTYQHSITSITYDRFYLSNINMRHNGMSLSLGLKYALAK